MWKIILLYIGITLALFCSPIKGKEVLDKIIKKKEKNKGNDLVSYRIDSIDKSDSTQSIFYITAIIKNNSATQEIKDTLSVLTTSDGILIDESK